MNISIKSVPNEIVRKLKERARLHHRSLQGELMTILEESVTGKLSKGLADVLERLRNVEISTGRDSTSLIRKERDAR